MTSLLTSSALNPIQEHLSSLPSSSPTKRTSNTTMNRSPAPPAPQQQLPSPLLPITSPPPSWTRSAMLRKCAHAFVMALATPEFDPHTFLRTFMTGAPSDDDPDSSGEETCRITHHGPSWATAKLPYLSKPSARGNGNAGTEYVGRDGCLRYFENLGATLRTRIIEDAFPPDEQLCVDAEAEVPGSVLTGRVCVDGRGRFENRETGWRWEERFMYRLNGFDEDGRVEHWEIWSDTLSAFSSTEQKA